MGTECQDRRILKMKLTLNDTYRLCAELWRWLEKHPMATKTDWPGWKNGVVKSYCFACEYVFNERGIPTCQNCPLIELWPKGCTEPPSPYYLWTQYVKRELQAKTIAEFCEKKLKERR